MNGYEGNHSHWLFLKMHEKLFKNVFWDGSPREPPIPTFFCRPHPSKNIYLFTIIKFGGKVRILWFIIPNHKKFALKKRNGVRWKISFQLVSTTSRARSSTQQHILLHTSRVTGTGRMWHRWCRLSWGVQHHCQLFAVRQESMKYFTLVTMKYYTVVNIKYKVLYCCVQSWLC